MILCKKGVIVAVWYDESVTPDKRIKSDFNMLLNSNWFVSPLNISKVQNVKYVSHQ